MAEQTDTNRLRAMWTQSAANIIERLREGSPVPADEVTKLQKALEGIEGREELERINKITLPSFSGGGAEFTPK